MADLNLNDFSGIIGNPENPYHQIHEDTCAIKSQQLILKDFGIYVTEDQLVDYSMAHGWYTGNGTQMADVGKLLVDAGIPCTQSIDANIYDLANELAQGHKVIVAVDSGELWDNGILDWLKDIFMGDTPDHALIVAGIDLTDPDNPMVILTDPGTGQPAQPYPLDQFMDAWGDSHNFMVSTDVPTPSSIDAFTAAGMTDMHLPQIAGVDYPMFQDFQTYSHLIDPSRFGDLNLAFNFIPSVDSPLFDDIMSRFGFPAIDKSLFPPLPSTIDPRFFDYRGLCDMDWLSPIETTSSDVISDQYETLSELYQEAMDYVQHYREEGNFFMATVWQSEASNIRHDMDNL